MAQCGVARRRLHNANTNAKSVAITKPDTIAIAKPESDRITESVAFANRITESNSDANTVHYGLLRQRRHWQRRQRRRFSWRREEDNSGRGDPGLC